MKTIGFIPVRLGSSRLPKKQLKTIGNKMLIDWIIDELKKSRELDEIVITTHAKTENIPLIEYAGKKGVELFWYCGDEEDVTGRLCSAAKRYNADICVLISGDCPLVSHEVVDRLVKALKDAKADVVIAKKNIEQRQPFVEGIIAASFCAWKRANSISHAKELKMHQFPVLFLCSHLFNFVFTELPPELHSIKHRFSVDTYSDLIFMNTIYNKLCEKGLEFNAKNAIKLLDDMPELTKINSKVRQKALNEIEKRFAIVLKEEISEDEFEYFVDFAHFLIDTKGWSGVIFLFTTKEAKNSDHREIPIIQGTNFDFSPYDLLFIDEHLIKKNLIPNSTKKIIPFNNRLKLDEWILLSNN